MKNYTQLVARQTGRTSRMIAEALGLNAQGYVVNILCSANHIDYIQFKTFEMCRKLNYTLPPTIRFKTVLNIGRENINWHEQSLIGAPPTTKLFIDHHVWAEQFGFAINGYHEYDDFSLLKRQPVYEKEELTAVDIINRGLIQDFKI